MMWPEHDRPHIQIKDAAANLGRIPTSQPVTHRFVVRNDGNAELLVVGTKANCECALPKLASRIVPPGTVVPFDVTFTPKKPGKRQQKILVETNDPVHPVTVLTITADVYDPATRPATMAAAHDGGVTP